VLSRLKQREKAALLVTELADEFASNRWLSTQTTAFGLMALADFYQGNSQQTGINATFSDDGAAEIKVNTKSLVFRQSLTLPASGNNKKIRISNKGDNPLFVRVIHSGIPEAGQELAETQNLDMRVRFTTTGGSPIDVSNLTQGTSFVAEVTISNPGMRGDYKELALSRIFPSGWEISNIRMDASAAALQQDAANHEDIRDDRVYTYFDLRSGTAKTYKVLLTATYEGRFYLPGFNVEAMYDATVYARNKGMWVEVKKE
jgi:alpha-2-macroglobulin